MYSATTIKCKSVHTTPHLCCGSDIYQLLSATNHCIFTAFQVKTNSTFTRHHNAATSQFLRRTSAMQQCTAIAGKYEWTLSHTTMQSCNVWYCMLCVTILAYTYRMQSVHFFPKRCKLNSTSASQPAARHSLSVIITIVIMTLGWGLFVRLAA